MLYSKLCNEYNASYDLIPPCMIPCLQITSKRTNDRDRLHFITAASGRTTKREKQREEKI